jgi:hypothetical protein
MPESSPEIGVPFNLLAWLPALIFAGALAGVLSVIFRYYASFTPYFWYILVFCASLVGYLFVFSINILSQYISCPHLYGINAKAAAMGALPSLGIICGIGWFITFFRSWRIPVISLFQSSYPITQKSSRACCNQTPSLYDMEKTHPTVRGYAYVYYLFFAMVISIMVGNARSTVPCTP